MRKFFDLLDDLDQLPALRVIMTLQSHRTGAKKTSEAAASIFQIVFKFCLIAKRLGVLISEEGRNGRSFGRSSRVVMRCLPSSRMEIVLSKNPDFTLKVGVLRSKYWCTRCGSNARPTD